MKTTIIYSDDDGIHTLLLPEWAVQHVLTELVKKGKKIHERPECGYWIKQRRESISLPSENKQFATEH